MKIHEISAEHLSIERIGEIVYGDYKIKLSDDAHKRIVAVSYTHLTLPTNSLV